MYQYLIKNKTVFQRMGVQDSKSIAIVFNGLYVGGAENFGISLANKFAMHGYKTTAIIFKKVDSPLLKLIDPRVELVYIQRSSKFDFILHNRFLKEITDRQIDKVFIIGLFPIFLSRFLSFKREKGISYFISLHSTIPASYKIYLQNLFYMRFIRSTDTVLFICNNQRVFYNEKYHLNPGKFDVIYNGVDIERFKPGAIPATTDLRAAMQIPATDKVILLVATMRLEKGHLDAIESLKYLHANHPDKRNTHLVFIGGGEAGYVASLKKLAKDYALENFIHFEGNQQDVRKYYEIADIFTLTSFSVETFSIAALEAMCYGLPISLTNIGGASEMVIEGKNGKLSTAKDVASIAESWAYLLNANLNRADIREIVVNNFSHDGMFKKYEVAVNAPKSIA